ncbi:MULTISPECIES: HAD family hydrolase [Olivibacter]|uniref:HAD family hydrolase n=1 Tax=Olivibacter oleidegradans TaxID=760123 RepID=A0ABV6HQR7_9SPHI|nr:MULTISPECIES: HAD family phosphatase [Olivibacter]MDM8173914.1 HAD family phosphatase [Olivibacter sp. 47]MDX3915098.1 HAD family phosphatase [Pseudosphingobacterium sp.]QEL03700.1 HAD family phosphatase [Olivibacter sp. LS-1]
MNHRAVIFDMDGVICHTNPYHAEAFKQFFDKRSIPYTEQEFIDHIYGKHNSYIMKYFLKKELSDEEVKELEDEKELLFRTIYANHIDPIPGFLSFLSSLKDAGYKTGVATSAPYLNLELILDKLAFAPQMESVLSSEDVEKHKPNPEVYLKSAKNLQVLPTGCVVFEDSFSGVTAAVNAGMKVVGVLSSHTKEELPPCDYYIRNYHDIDLETLDRLFR